MTTTQAQADAFFTSLLSGYIGQKINPDGRYGLQCKDVADRTGMDYFSTALFTAMGGGNANEMITGYNSKYFIRIENKVGDLNSIPRRGDIAIFSGNSVNPYGHIAPVWSATANSMTLVQQDGFAPPLQFVDGNWYSNKPTHWATLNYDNYGTGPCEYWLRPKLEMLKIPGDTTAPASSGGNVAKKYKLETKWTTGFQVARSFYGYGSKPTGITIHHWGNLGQRFDDVCNFLCDTTSPARKANPTSAHYVLEDARIACLAVPTVATYHAGSTAGNGSTIGLECRPEMTKGDVDTLVQLIYELEKAYGSMNIYFHQEWFATACPGKYTAIRTDIINRVNAMAKNGGKDPKLATATTTAAATSAAKPAASATAKPAKPAAAKLTTADKQLITDINGNVRTLNTVLNFRFGKYEKGLNDIAAIKKKIGA